MWQNVENYLDKGIIDLFDYWIGYLPRASEICLPLKSEALQGNIYENGTSFSLVMSSFIDPTQKDIYGRNCIQDGDSWSMDFMIGCENHLRQGLAAPILILWILLLLILQVIINAQCMFIYKQDLKNLNDSPLRREVLQVKSIL